MGKNKLTGLKVIFCLCMLFAAAGCNKEQGSQVGTVSPGAEPSITVTIAPTPTMEAIPTDAGEEPVISGTAEEILKYYKERTFGYAGEMLSGEFALCDDFSPELSAALSERDMRAAWKQAVAGLGEPLDKEGEEVGETGEAALYAEASFLNPPTSSDVSGNIADFGGCVVTSAQIPYKAKTAYSFRYLW